MTWEIKAVVPPTAAPGKKTVPLAGVAIQACDKNSCFYSKPSAIPSPAFEVTDEEPVAVAAEWAPLLNAGGGSRLPGPPAPPGATPTPVTATPAAPAHAGLVRKAPVPTAEYEASLNALFDRLDKSPDVGGVAKTGLSGLLVTAALWGLVSLVTPCVFPMIPITVSIFLKQSHNSTSQTLKLATVYCLTIVVVLGVSAVALLKVFVDLSVSPWMNLFLGGLFVVFALSLFGWYEITLPRGLLKFTQSRQGGGGVVGTVFGALAFTMIGFTCVAPFLGGFAGMASSGNYATGELVLAGLAFSTAFASPFFLLALFPSLLKKLPRSGGWLDSVKAVMGFLELAAALKFLRTAELRWLPEPRYFTYDLVLGAWVAIAVACGLYLLNVFRLPHDEERPNIGVPRLLFALAFISLGLYLQPATFKTAEGKNQRPGGVVFAWVDAFLLPEPGSSDEFPFGSDLTAALEKAKKDGRPVFVDFTGESCTNCRYNENNVFTRRDVGELLRRYELVQMYTDGVPVAFYRSPPADGQRQAEALANRAFKERAFGTEQLPRYVVFAPTPDGRVKVAGVYDEGKINDPDRFADFLRQPLEGK